MDRWQRVLRPRFAILVASGFVLACSDAPTEAQVEDTPVLSGQRIIAAIACTADVAAGELTCERESPGATGEEGPSYLIVGGQGTFVTLTGTNTSYNTNNQRWRADVTLTNLIPQALGTPDGTTGDSIKIFIHDGPTVILSDPAGGTVSFANPDGTDAFTGVNQPYLGYLGPVAPDAVSEKRVWQFLVSQGVTFEFWVYVSASVQYPDGWVEVTPATATIGIGGVPLDLDAVAYDVVGRPDDGATFTWTSGDPNIATVDETTGEVTGVAAGTVTITASSDGPEADGTAEITVTG